MRKMCVCAGREEIALLFCFAVNQKAIIYSEIAVNCDGLLRVGVVGVEKGGGGGGCKGSS